MPLFGLGRSDDAEKELSEEGEEEHKTRKLDRRRPGQRKGRQDHAEEEDNDEELDEQEEKKRGPRRPGRHCRPDRPAGTNQPDEDDEEVDDEEEEGGEKIVVNEGESIQVSSEEHEYSCPF